MSQKPNLMPRKKEWVGEIDFPKTNNIEEKFYYADDLIVWKGQELSQDYLRSIDEDARDEIAKDLLNFFIEVDFINDFRYREEDIVKSWKQLCEYSGEITEIDGVKYINNAGASGYKLYRHYFPNLIKVRGEKRASIYDALTNKELLWKVIRNRIGNTLLYDQQQNKCLGNVQFPMNIHLNQCLIGARNSGISSMASIFKPHIAKTIYDYWVKEGDVVLDYSAGFGTRMMGLMSLNRNNKYLAYEPNTETFNNLNKLINDYKFNAEIKCCGSEEELFEEKVSLAFSSPPYFNHELYVDEETQCYNKFPQYDEWMEKYWRKTITNIKKILKDDGIFGINIGGQANEKMIKISNDMNKIITEEGFKLIDTWYMKTTRSHLSSKKNNEDKKFKLEGIYFYRKIDE